MPTEPERRLVEIGRVGRPHGVDGAFVVEGGSESEDRFRVGGEVLLDGDPATVVVSRRIGRGRRAIRLDRPATRGSLLSIARADLPPPEPGAYYVADLVGLRVEDAGTVLGLVTDVLPGAANDNLELDSGLLVPLVEDAVAEVDLEAGRIVLNAGFID